MPKLSVDCLILAHVARFGNLWPAWRNRALTLSAAGGRVAGELGRVQGNEETRGHWDFEPIVKRL